MFVVTDTETTGATSATDRLIEIAAVKVQGGRILGSFSRLINPRRSVPRFITELTGISTAMVFDQPGAEEALPEYLDFLGDGVFVAHNMAFDHNFIGAELERLGRPRLKGPGLCTLRLARRLLPGLRSKGLTSLADFYGLTFKHRHRALGDAEVTAEVLLRFLARIEFEHGVERLEDLLTYQFRRYSEPRQAPRHLQYIRENILGRLPNRPGVYFMLDAKGVILYIGKAKSLRDRVRSYFSGIEGHAPRTRKLLEVVRDVRWTETGSELNALLLESRLIKEQQPAFNRALRRYRNRPFIRLDTSEAFPRVSAASVLKDDGAEYFGPVGGTAWAEQLVEIINRFYGLRECTDDVFERASQCVYASMGRCGAPCGGGEGADAYPEEVQRVRRFLRGEDRSVLPQIEAAMRAAAQRLDFEQAALYRNWLQRLERLLSRQRRIAGSVLEHNAAIALPGVADGSAQVFLVRFGRPAHTLHLGASPTPEEIGALRAAVAQHFDPAAPAPSRYFKAEVEEIRLLAHWMYVYRDKTQHVHWRPDMPPEAFVAAILRSAADPLVEDAAEV